MQLASIASSRLEISIRRIAAVVILISSTEVFINALSQSQAYNTAGEISLAVFVISSALAAISGWTNYHWRIMFRIHGGVVLALVWSVLPTSDAQFFAPDGKPWIWWALGVGAVVIGVSCSPRVWTFYIPLLSMSWFATNQLLLGSARTLDALLDSAYILVFGFAISGLVQLVREGASDVDLANTEAIQSAIEQARVDAIERERGRLDALVHDQVLHTLLLAARAESSDQQRQAAQSAKGAIASLTKAEKQIATDGKVTPLGLFRAIEKAAVTLDGRIEVISKGGGSESISPEVAQAMTEATLQALDNAVQHSKANRIQLTLDSPEIGKLHFEITDDGVGFRPERATRDRIGIRTSIEGRVQAVGGSAEIQSQPGLGVKVLLRWPDV